MHQPPELDAFPTMSVMLDSCELLQGYITAPHTSRVGFHEFIKKAPTLGLPCFSNPAP